MSNSYTAKDITVLEGLEPVRKRPGMYIGSTDSKGLHHLLTEIVDNSLDEAIANRAKNITVYLHQNSTVSVSDDGAGIPVDLHSSGISALEITMTRLHAGGKFNETAYQASGGLHGIGASAVNALSSSMQVIVKRDNKYFTQKYHLGKPDFPVKKITLKEVESVIPSFHHDFLNQISGTLTIFKSDPTIFKEHTKFDYKFIKNQLRERAYLVAGVSIHLGEETTNKEAHFYFESGIKSLLAHHNRNKKPLHDVIKMNGRVEEISPIEVEVVMQYTDTFQENLISYANTINTCDGGVHLTGFRTALTRVVKDYLAKNGLNQEKGKKLPD